MPMLPAFPAPPFADPHMPFATFGESLHAWRRVSEAELVIRLLGGIAIRSGSTELSLTSRPAQALLAYLVLHAPRAQRRELLSGVIWPDATEAVGRSNLRYALWQVRQVLGEAHDSVLRTDRVCIAFQPDARTHVDTIVIEELDPDSATKARILAALEPVSGELLPGFYEEWVLEHRERIRRRIGWCMNRLVRALVEERSWDQATLWSERWVRVDATSESAYRALMRSEHGLGNAANVDEAFERCKSALDRELGAEPSDKTVELYARLGGEPVASSGFGRVGPLPERIDPRRSLHYRLPNPPPVFCGRDAESRALASASERGPVAVVTGLGGVGKTALVLHTVHERWPELAATALMISVRAGDPSHQVLLEVIRALTEAGSVPIDWSSLLADIDVLLAHTIDLAERSQAFIVIDDLHHDPDQDRLLLGLAQYARGSRWIATSRIEPVSTELGAQCVRLEGLDSSSLKRLAEAHAPRSSPDEIEHAIVESGGSPWFLQQCLSRRPRAGKDASEYLLAGLDSEAKSMLLALCSIEAPLSVEEISGFSAVPPSDVLDSLERRGLLQRESRGLRVHDVARAVLVPGLEAEEMQRQQAAAARALAGSTRPHAIVEAVRLALALGAEDQAEQLLALRGEELLRSGYAPALLAVLEPYRDERWARLRLRSSVLIGSAELLARARLPGAPSAEDQLLFARALYAGGRPAQAAIAATTLFELARTEGSTKLALEAGLTALEARALENPAELRRVVQALSELELDAKAEVRRRAYFARSHAFMGDYEAALFHIEAAERGVGGLSLPRRLEVRHQLVIVQISLGRIAEAERTLAALVAELPVAAVDLTRGRYSRVWRMPIAVAEGRLAEAVELRDRMLPFGGARSMQRFIIVGADLHRRLTTGPFDDLGSRIENYIAEAEIAKNTYFYWKGLMLRTRLRCLFAASAGGATRASELPPAVGFHADLIELFEAECEVRRGHSISEQVDREWATRFPYGVEAHAIAELVRAEAALAAGEVERARRHAIGARLAAEDLGYLLHELEARLVCCDLAVATGQWAELEDELRSLAEVLTSTDAPRLATELRFYREVAAESLDTGRLELLAGALDVAPVAARRARALLGGVVDLDAIDRRIIAAIQRK